MLPHQTNPQATERHTSPLQPNSTLRAGEGSKPGPKGGEGLG